jgi:hypothetical protein
MAARGGGEGEEEATDDDDVVDRGSQAMTAGAHTAPATKARRLKSRERVS